MNGNNTTRDEKEIYREFVETRLFDFIRGGLTQHPRDLIRDWIHENYELDKDNFNILFTHITVSI